MEWNVLGDRLVTDVDGDCYSLRWFVRLTKVYFRVYC